MKTSLDRQRDVIIPHRMMAADTLNVALKLRENWNNAPKPMEIYFGGDLKIEGTSYGWTNPVIEAGVVHCRALLEFLGLKPDRKNPDKLEQTNFCKTVADDITLGDFKVNGSSLRAPSVQDVISKYAGPSDEAERALARIIRVANKGIAHSTTIDFFRDKDQQQLLEIGSRGVPSLIVSYFYTPLGLPAPKYEIGFRHGC